MTMPLKIRLVFIIILQQYFFPMAALGATMAHFIGTDGVVTGFNAETDTVLSSRKLDRSDGQIQDGEKTVLADPVNSKLFVVTGCQETRVLVYDLRTLQFIKDMGVVSSNPDITLFRTHDSKKIFIVWWNAELAEGAWQFDVIDGQSLGKIETLDFFFFPKNTTSSVDSTILYAIEGGDNGKIKLIDTSMLKITSTIDLNTVWRSDVFARAVIDSVNERILIGENEKTNEDTMQFSYFIYNAMTRVSTPRINTGLKGEAKLDPSGAKLFFDEEQDVESPDKSHILSMNSVGRLHVYNLNLSSESAVIPFSVDGQSDILGVHPSGAKVYLVGYVAGVRKLIVIDVLNKRVADTLRFPDSAFTMIFYEN